MVVGLDGPCGSELALALLLDHAQRRGFRGGNLVYAAVLLAWVDPSLIAGFLWVLMFDFYYGSLNVALKTIGLTPQNWLGDQARLAIIVNTWRGTAFPMLIFLSGLKTIPAWSEVLMVLILVDKPGSSQWRGAFRLRCSSPSLWATK